MSRVRKISIGLLLGFAVILLNPASPSQAQVVSFPTISGISPSQGTARGGTLVTITGTDFQPGALVYVGGQLASAPARLSSTQMTATTPQAGSTSGSSATVTVVNPDGSVATLTAGYFFSAVESPLTVSGVTPPRGPNSGGTNVNIAGTGFNASATVFFGDVPITAVTVLGSAAIIVRTPPNISGVVAISIVNPDGTKAALPSAFTYDGGVSVTSVSPGASPTVGGATVRIAGDGFARGATVRFADSLSPSVIYVNSQQLVAVTPSVGIGTGALVVTNPDGQTAVTQGFAYGPPPNSVAPVIANLQPQNGPGTGGTSLLISGTGFSGGATVYFGTVMSASVTWNSSGSLLVRAPANVSGPVPVRIVNSDGSSATLANGFTYDGAPGLTLGGITPTSVPAAGGALVTVTGNAINPGSWVTFNGVPALWSVVTGTTQILAIVPPGLTTPVTIAVTQIGGVGATVSGALVLTGGASPTPPVTAPPVTAPPVTTPPVTTPPVTTPPATGAGVAAFLAAPIFSASGQALVVFAGGSTDQLEAAAASAKATGAWAQDATGGFQLLVVGGPVFLKDQFRATFAAGLRPNTPMTLTR